jgi:hypothetical protein
VTAELPSSNLELEATKSFEMNEAEHCRQRVAASGLGPDLVNIDRVAVNFDWLVPSSSGEAITFILNIQRGTRRSSTRFDITLAKLAGVDLQRLHDLLAERPKGYQLTYEIAWLLELAFEQEMPTSTVGVRHQKVRELLLCK